MKSKQIQRIMSVEIDSWADLFYLAQIMKFGDWVFRGHASEKWKLASSRERDVMPGEDAYAESKDPHAYRDLARHLNRPRLIGDEKEVWVAPHGSKSWNLDLARIVKEIKKDSFALKLSESTYNGK